MDRTLPIDGLPENARRSRHGYYRSVGGMGALPIARERCVGEPGAHGRSGLHDPKAERRSS